VALSDRNAALAVGLIAAWLLLPGSNRDVTLVAIDDIEPMLEQASDREPSA
jgi:hypothetical protein